MNFKKILFVGALACISASAFTQEIKFYGFVRNYYTYDSRLSKSGTAELYNYLPLDRKLSEGTDLNAIPTMKWASLTSRLGLDVKGYEYQGFKFSAKIEADFYSGLSGVTGPATFRLRQAYMDIASPKGHKFRLGQAWHPMAADIPDCIALETGVPFGPFSRSPQLSATWKLSDRFSLLTAGTWQVQYTSAGPEGASANYQKYSMIPELYAGLNYSHEGLTARLGADMLSIRPRVKTATALIDESITTFSLFGYLQYSKGLFRLKAKSVLAQAGEHMNLFGGYGLSSINADGSREYTPTLTSSSWLSISYGKTYKASLFLGYANCLGTLEPLLPAMEGAKYAATSAYDNEAKKDLDTGNYLCKSAYPNLNSAFRIAPTLSWNVGKFFTLALEYQLTAAQYGDYVKLQSADGKISYTCVGLNGLATDNLHWVFNHRVQLMTRFKF